MQQVFLCQYQEHENELINGFCLNIICKLKAQCCTQCLMTNHQNHITDCKTIVQLKLLFQKNLKEIPNILQQTSVTFEKVEKAHQEFGKLFICERNKIIELEKNIKQPKFFLYNRDFFELKKLCTIIKELISDKQQTVFSGLLQEKVKITQALIDFGKINTKVLKEQLENNEKNVNLKMDFDDANIFSNQIRINCEQQYCCDQFQCCNFCKNDKKILIFELIRPIIQKSIKILNSWLQTMEIYFAQAKYLYLTIKQFFETQEQLIQEVDKFLETQNFYQLMLKIKQMKEWFKIQEFQFKKLNMDKLSSILQNYTADLLENFLILFRTIKKDEKMKVDETILNKQIQLRQNIPKEVICKTNGKSQDLNQQVNYQHVKTQLTHQQIILTDYSKAVQTQKKAIQLKPNLYEELNNKGLDLFQQNQYENAILCYDQAIQQSPLQSEVFFNKGRNALCRLFRYSSGIQSYDQAIMLNPSFSQAIHKKGVALYNQGNYEHALNFFDMAIQLNPNDSELYNDKGKLAKTNIIGKALRSSLLVSDAILCYNKAILLNPNFVEAFQNKAKALCYLKCYEEAIQYYDKVIELNNRNLPTAQLNRQKSETLTDKGYHVIIKLIGDALTKLNCYQEASECISKAIYLNPYSIKLQNKGNYPCNKKELALKELIVKQAK